MPNKAWGYFFFKFCITLSSYKFYINVKKYTRVYIHFAKIQVNDDVKAKKFWSKMRSQINFVSVSWLQQAVSSFSTFFGTIQAITKTE